MIKKLNWWAFIVLVATSCGIDNPLQVSSETPSVTVFYGTVTDNAGEDVTGPGFFYGPVTITWNGDKPLKLTSFFLSFPATTGKLAANTECEFDSELLETAFSSATNLILQPGTPYVSSGRFICTGLAAANEKASFVATGAAKVRGYTGDAGSQKFYKGDTKVFLYWFPNGDN